MSYVQERYPNSTVHGVLVAGGHAVAPQALNPPTLKVMAWQEVLLRSRREHMDLLAALLAGAEADAGDSRVQLITELGGTVVRDFLQQMATHDPRLAATVAKLTPPPKPAEKASEGTSAVKGQDSVGNGSGDSPNV